MDVDTTGYLVAALNADIQTADVQKTSKDYEVPFNIFDRLVDVEVARTAIPRLSRVWPKAGIFPMTAWSIPSI